MRRKNKLNAEKVQVDGIQFDSKKEARHYMDLKLLERAGEIHHLQCHPKYNLEVNGHKVCAFWPDFEFTDKHGVRHVQDVKGYKGGSTWNAYRIKAKLFHAIHGIEVDVI